MISCKPLFLFSIQPNNTEITMTTSDKVLANSHLELPSFSELIQVIERDYLVGNTLQHSNENINIFQRTSCTTDNSIDSLKTLANITTLKHYTSYDIIRRKEEELYRYFISCSSSLENLFEKLSSIKSTLLQVSVADTNKFDRNLDTSLFGLEKDGKQISILRKEFRKWVMETPGKIHCDVFEELNNIISNISKLINIKEEYKEERILNNFQQEIRGDTLLNNIKNQELQRQMNIRTSSNKDNTTISDNLGITEANFVKRPFTVRNNRVQKKPKKYTKLKSLRQQNYVCTHCGTTQTPEWRKGPKGSRTLCNACGLFYSKLIKKFGINESAKILRIRRENKQISDRTIPCTLDMYHK